MEFREIFRVVAKWLDLDNKGYTISLPLRYLIAHTWSSGSLAGAGQVEWVLSGQRAGR